MSANRLNIRSIILRKLFLQMINNTLSSRTGICKNNRRPVRLHQIINKRVKSVMHLPMLNINQIRNRAKNLQIHLLDALPISDFARPWGLIIIANKKMRYLVKRSNSGRQANPCHTRRKQLQTLKAERKVNTTLILSQRMNFINNTPLNRLQQVNKTVTAQNNSQTLRRSNKNMRRLPQHGRLLRSRRITSADSNPYPKTFAGKLLNLLQRLNKINLNILIQSLQRRNINSIHIIPKNPCTG